MRRLTEEKVKETQQRALLAESVTFPAEFARGLCADWLEMAKALRSIAEYRELADGTDDVRQLRWRALEVIDQEEFKRQFDACEAALDALEEANDG
jgi:hypothetical protein